MRVCCARLSCHWNWQCTLILFRFHLRLVLKFAAVRTSCSDALTVFFFSPLLDISHCFSCRFPLHASPDIFPQLRLHVVVALQLLVFLASQFDIEAKESAGSIPYAMKRGLKDAKWADTISYLFSSFADWSVIAFGASFMMTRTFESSMEISQFHSRIALLHDFAVI